MRTTLSRTLAVMALKSRSHEPQSLSIASLVRVDVVNGPGVSRIGRTCGFSFIGRPSMDESANAPALGGSRHDPPTPRYSNDTASEVPAIKTAIAAAAPISPASSRLRMAIEASLVSG